MKSIYCPSCDELVSAEVKNVTRQLVVRGSDVHASQFEALCPNCGEMIADEEISRANLDSALAAYRVKEELLSPEEIKRAYAQYGLTQKSFATLMNLGGATLSRYEHGALQTKQIDVAIRQASQPENILALLEERGSDIPASQVESARKSAASMLAEISDAASAEVFPEGNFRLSLSGSTPSVRNGFRKLDWRRAKEMVVYFAHGCTNLGRVKLNKAMFYADFACFASSARSMSGLMYARATHGPVVDQYDAFFGEMVREGVIQECSVLYGPYDVNVFQPISEFDASIFTRQELDILGKVAEFVNEFATATELSNYSHKERLWVENDDGKLLSYLAASELNDLDRFIGA